MWLEGRVFSAMAERGGPSKADLGPDPHLGALDLGTFKDG